MRRKLVSLDVFGGLERRSLTHAGRELKEAADVLGRALGTDHLQFQFFDENNAVYRVPGGNFVHATYQIDENAVTFDNITEMVLDQDTVKKQLREYATHMVDAAIDGDKIRADNAFQEYVALMCRSRTQQKRLEESHKEGLACKSGPKNFKFPKDGGKAVKAGKKANEWAKVANNVLGYVSFMESGDILSQAKVKKTAGGDLSGIRIPNTKSRNEGKILHMTYKTLMSTDLKWLRESAHALPNDNRFLKAACELKRMAKLGMNKDLEEGFGKVAVAHPAALLLTQYELAKVIREALDQAGEGNFDDSDCDFLAEGILRESHKGFKERVQTVARLAGVMAEEVAYEDFQKVAEDFYPRLDEQAANEHRMFNDLYESIIEVRHAATACDNEDVRAEAAEVLAELHKVVGGIEAPTLQLAAQAAEWLGIVAESSTFVRGQKDWDVDRSIWPHVTQVGDHPALNSKPKTNGDPGQTNDLWQDYPGGAAIGPDGEYPSAKHARDLGRKGFGNQGPTDWSNPYMPKAPEGVFTMKPAKGVDKGHDDGLVQDDGGEAWPNIKHDHLPKPGYPKMWADNLVDTRTK